MLEDKQIGVEDDFLAMGGNSIQAASILALVNERYAWTCNLSIFLLLQRLPQWHNLIQQNNRN